MYLSLSYIIIITYLWLRGAGSECKSSVHAVEKKEICPDIKIKYETYR